MHFTRQGQGFPYKHMDAYSDSWLMLFVSEIILFWTGEDNTLTHVLKVTFCETFFGSLCVITYISWVVCERIWNTSCLVIFSSLLRFTNFHLNLGEGYSIRQPDLSSLHIVLISLIVQLSNLTVLLNAVELQFAFWGLVAHDDWVTGFRVGLKNWSSGIMSLLKQGMGMALVWIKNLKLASVDVLSFSAGICFIY